MSAVNNFWMRFFYIMGDISEHMHNFNQMKKCFEVIQTQYEQGRLLKNTIIKLL